MSSSPLLDELIHALRVLPGIGPKSAQRMAFSLLENKRPQGLHLAEVLQKALTQVQQCSQCRTFCETASCTLCLSSQRDQQLLCIVEKPSDIFAIERTAGYRGVYFVLHGHLSPLDGIGPNEIGSSLLKNRLESTTFQEVIIATNPTVEGEATAHYLTTLIKPYGTRISRIAYGVPLGSELDYVDSTTLAHALRGREQVT